MSRNTLLNDGKDKEKRSEVCVVGYRHHNRGCDRKITLALQPEIIFVCLRYLSVLRESFFHLLGESLVTQ